MKQPAVYIISNQKNGTIYTGVTSDLVKRIYQHKNSLAPGGFSAKYKCHNLVFFELHHSMESAILREKQIKGGSRKKKLDLIEVNNPEWKDLYTDIL